MIKTLFLVPEADNDGVRFADDMFDRLEGRLTAAFGAFSRRRGVVGAWQHEGRVYRDESREYTIALRDWMQLPEWLTIVREARVTFRQLALYIEVAGIPSILED